MDTKQAYILSNMEQELKTLSRECKEIFGGNIQALKESALALNAHLIGEDTKAKYKNGCTYLDDIVEHWNYIEDPDSKKGYSDKYDVRVAGTYYGKKTVQGYKGEPTKEDFYTESILDKFHKFISLVYYTVFDLPIDYRPKAPTPCSACDLAESYWLAGEETDEND